LNPYVQLILLLLIGGFQIVYGVVFVARLRPRLRRYLSAHLGIAIHDGYSGVWTAEATTPWRLKGLVSLLDISILIGGILGPLSCLLLLLFGWAGAANSAG
jgi:hypothetical protein